MYYLLQADILPIDRLMPPRKSALPESDLLKGTLDMLILKTLTVQSMHGYAIVRHIERLSGGVFNVEHGSLYPALERLQGNGLVSGKWGESPTGRRARYYTITTAGRRHLGDRVSSFDRVLSAIAGVMNGA
jgi:PadR family transcriptional regulator, regulatory protein PadR